MTYACLWIPSWPIAAASPGKRSASPETPPPDARLVEVLTPALLDHVPRVAIERRGVVWADVGGLPMPQTAITIRRCVQRVVGDKTVRVGIATTPVAALVGALYGTGPQDEAAHAAFASAITVVRPSGDRSFLARHQITVLEPSRHLETFFAGVGIETCGDLARLALSDVELRFGEEGVRLWRLARADDARMMFGPRELDRPSASVEWTDYAITDVERVLFPVMALVHRVLDELTTRGVGTRRLVLRFALANGQRLEHPIGAARVTADRDRWGRLVRYALESLQLPDAITGVSVVTEGVGPSATPQGDLYDRGFATARDAERAVGRVEDVGGVPTRVTTQAHPLPEQRVMAVRDPWPMGQVTSPTARHHTTPAGPENNGRHERRPSSPPMLVLRTLIEPERIVVTTIARRDHRAPKRYRVIYRTTGRRGVREHTREIGIYLAIGPTHVAGGHANEAPYEREYFRCLTDDGLALLLYRDLTVADEEAWYLAGRWT